MDKEFLKEKVSYYRLWLVFLYPSGVSLLVWIFNNYAKISAVKLCVTGLLLVGLFVVIAIFNRKMRKLLKKLEIYNGN